MSPSRIPNVAAKGTRRPKRSFAARPVAGPATNALLISIPRRARSIFAQLEPVSLTFGDILYDAKPIRHVYFPLDCLVSLLAPLKGHLSVEVGLVGNEGMVGVPLALGLPTSPVQAIVQGSGTALRLSAATFVRELKRCQPLQRAVNRYIYLLMGQLTQTAACNAFHSIEARFARWMLMTRDRIHSDELELTHEFLARMLGVRRVGVTVAAGNMQRRGLITYSRGRIVIVDPDKLAKTACECYGAVNALYDTVQSRSAA